MVTRFVPPPTPAGRPTPEMAARKRDSAYVWGRFDSLDEMDEQEWEAFDVLLRLRRALEKPELSREEYDAVTAADKRMKEALGAERHYDVTCIFDWYLVLLVRDARAAHAAALPKRVRPTKRR